MTDGRLAAGERLPSTRALAATLGVSRTVVTAAYAQLFAEGWLEGRHGSGTYVADGASAADGTGGPGRSRSLAGAGRGARAGERRTGHGGERSDPRPGRSRAGDRPAARDPLDGRHRPRGVAAGLAQRRRRGAYRRRRTRRAAPTLRDGPHRLPAAQPGRPLLGRSSSWSPGAWPGAWACSRPRCCGRATGWAWRSRATRPRGRCSPPTGLRLVPCPVDADGLRRGRAPGRAAPRLHHPGPPVPARRPAAVPRRQALIAWARATGALIVEDDYDGEFRYDVGAAARPVRPGPRASWCTWAPRRRSSRRRCGSAGWWPRPELVARLAGRGGRARRLGRRPGPAARCSA